MIQILSHQIPTVSVYIYVLETLYRRLLSSDLIKITPRSNCIRGLGEVDATELDPKWSTDEQAECLGLDSETVHSGSKAEAHRL